MNHVELPKIRRELSNFIRDEKAMMTKKNMLKAGIALGAFMGLSTTVSGHHVNTVPTPHSNSLSLSYEDPEAVGQHSHHTQHAESC